jgi:hypothetical protein
MIVLAQLKSPQPFEALAIEQRIPSDAADHLIVLEELGVLNDVAE